MNKKQKRQAVHQALIQIREDVAKRNRKLDRGMGICGNLIHYVRRANPSNYVGVLDIIKPLFKTWSEYSGDNEYPVKSYSRYDPNPMDAYNYSDRRWSGNYGKARLRLLNHLIEQTQG